MKLLVYFVALSVCVGMKTSNADSGKSIEEKRKFVSISNKAKEDALIQCKSGKENFNKTLKPGEKIRWGLPEKGGSTICSLDIGSKKGVHGYFSAFLAKYCNKECKWRVFDDGMLNLKLGGGEWKSFKLKKEEESAPAPAVLKNDKNAPPPMKNDEGKSKPGNSRNWKSPAPAPATHEKTKSKSAPPGNAKTAPPPTKHDQGKLKPGIPWKPKSPAPAPANGKTKSAPPPTKKINKEPAPAPSENSKTAPSPTKKVNEGPAPMKHHRRKSRHGNPPKSSGKTKSGAKSAPPPTKQIKNAPPPMKQSKPTNSPKWESAAPAPPNDTTKPVSKSAPPPTQQIKKVPENAKTAPPPTKHGRRKLKHGNPSKSKSPAPAPPRKLKSVEAPPPTEISPRPTKQDAKRSPPPTEGGDESEGPDPEFSPPARSPSTFYSCIKKDPR